MFVISDSIHINAPIQRCFLLSTSLELVKRTLNLELVASESSRTSGMIANGDRLMWRGWLFGLPQMHESVITQYERPDFFQEMMGRGRFKRFQHDHTFVEIGGRTLLSDKVRFSLPFGWVTKPLGRSLVMPCIAQLLRRRLDLLKRVAESDEWKEYLADEG